MNTYMYYKLILQMAIVAHTLIPELAGQKKVILMCSKSASKT